MLMKLINRASYMDTLTSLIGVPDIKVITGIRRSGKSKLLESLRDFIEASLPNSNVIHINYNLNEFEGLLEYHELLTYVKEHRREGAQNFLLIDEVQMCNGFERAVNGFHASEQYDIFITGSNAFLLSSDLSTLFAGRTFEIEVFPFSFEEYRLYKTMGARSTATLMSMPASVACPVPIPIARRSSATSIFLQFLRR